MSNPAQGLSPRYQFEYMWLKMYGEMYYIESFLNKNRQRFESEALWWKPTDSFQNVEMTQNQSHIGILYPSLASLKVFSSSLQNDRIIKTSRLALDTDHSLHEPNVTCQSWLFDSHKMSLCVSFHVFLAQSRFSIIWVEYDDGCGVVCFLCVGSDSA